VGVGFDVDPVELEASLGPDEWHFVHERYIGDRDVHRYYEPRERNVVLVHNTTNVTHYTVVNRRIVNRSVDVREVERVRGTPVRRTRIVNRADLGRPEVRTNRDVAVYVPPQPRHAERERGRMEPQGGPVPSVPRREAPVAQRPTRKRAGHAIKAHWFEAEPAARANRRATYHEPLNPRPTHRSGTQTRQGESGFGRVRPDSGQHAAPAREARQHGHPAHPRRDLAIQSSGVPSDHVARRERRREYRRRER